MVCWFICYLSSITWLYLVKHKVNALRCFEEFHRIIVIQLGVKGEVVRFVNGLSIPPIRIFISSCISWYLVADYFNEFHKIVDTQFDAIVKVIRFVNEI